MTTVDPKKASLTARVHGPGSTSSPVFFVKLETISTNPWAKSQIQYLGSRGLAHEKYKCIY